MKSRSCSTRPTSPLDELTIAAAIIRRRDELLMVLQGRPDEEAMWSIPGGRAEPGEFVRDTLTREVREETGLVVRDPGRIAFVVQVDDRVEGYFATVWTWDVAVWHGEVAVADPDQLIHEAAWVPLDEACRRLELISWQPLTVRYLRGALDEQQLWFRRVHRDGREEWL